MDYFMKKKDKEKLKEFFIFTKLRIIIIIALILISFIAITSTGFVTDTLIGILKALIYILVIYGIVSIIVTLYGKTKK